MYKKKNQPAPNIKISDNVIYSVMNKEMSPINQCQICQLLDVFEGRNGDEDVRSLKFNPQGVPWGPFGPQAHKLCHKIVSYGNLALVFIDFVKNWL